MQKCLAGFRREDACFLPDLLDVAAHSYLRGHIIQAGEEFVCTSCGVVNMKAKAIVENGAANQAKRSRGFGLGPLRGEGP